MINKTITKTALDLSLTPSAVSQQLKILQKETGINLLEKQGKLLTLTTAGKLLAAHCDNIIGAIDTAEADMKSFISNPSGELSIVMFPSGAAIFLPQLIKIGLQNNIHITGTDLDYSALATVEFLPQYDIALVHRDERDKIKWSPRYEAIPILREPLEVLLPQNHPLSIKSSIPISDLAHETWIEATGGIMVDDIFRSIATITGSNPKIVQRINDFHIVEELVAAQVGIALFPKFSMLSQKNLILKPLAEINLARVVEAITLPGGKRNPLTKKVLYLLREIGANISAPKPSRPNDTISEISSSDLVHAVSKS